MPESLDAGLARHVTLAFRGITEGCAGAMRLGHAVSLFQEPEADLLLQKLRAGPIPIVLNLTSNALLLGVAGRDHPFPLLLAAGVPLALSTDDPGILRTTLLQQFVTAAAYPSVRYADLETLARNSLEFAFLEGDGLWSDAGTDTQPVAECRGLLIASGQPDEGCLRWAQRSPRARLQLHLEHDLTAFRAAVEAGR